MGDYDRKMSQTYPEFADVEGPNAVRSVEDERAHRKRMVAIGYRIFGALHWGQLGDGHISARDPEQTDHFWLLDYGIPFRLATVESLILVSPNGTVAAGGDPSSLGSRGPNTAGYNIHSPILAARPEAVSAAHTHTGYGTPWSAMAQPFAPISQESCRFVFDQSIFDDEELEVRSPEAGARIAESLGDSSLCILRNHGLLTVGTSVEEAVGLFVLAERVAEVHIKTPDAKPISLAGAEIVAKALGESTGGFGIFQWLQRDLVPDTSVVD